MKSQKERVWGVGMEIIEINYHRWMKKDRWLRLNLTKLDQIRNKIDYPNSIKWNCIENLKLSHKLIQFKLNWKEIVQEIDQK